MKGNFEPGKEPLLPEKPHSDMLKCVAESGVEFEGDRLLLRLAIPNRRLDCFEVRDLPLFRSTAKYVCILIGSGNSELTRQRGWKQTVICTGVDNRECRNR